MRKNTVLLAIFLAAFSAHLFCQPEEENIIHKFMGKLNLTEQQKKDVEKIGFEMKKQAIDLKANVATSRLELQQLFKADNPDKTAIEKKINELADFGVQLQMIKINSWFSINKLLTAEQQKIWKKALEHGPALERHEMMKKHGDRKSMHPDKDGPMEK